MLTREMIEQVQDFDKEEVEVPEWGGSIWVRSMTVKGADEMNALYARMPSTKKVSLKKDSDIEISEADVSAMIGLRAEYLSRCVCDEEGILMFDDAAGRAILNSKNPSILERIEIVALRVNKMDAGSMEQEKKELLATVSIGSNSNSV